MVLYLLTLDTINVGFFTHTTMEMNFFDRTTSLLLMATSNGEVLTFESLYKQISYYLLFLTLTPICMHFVQQTF